MSIADVGWRTFLGMLAYKAELYHRQFLTVDPKNTTQACHECGFVMGTAGPKNSHLQTENGHAQSAMLTTFVTITLRRIF
ncbi:hypothetical protein AOT41_01390 [Limosilactobacillus fermentum]|nr:hypothetical protein AOT41_01390 [Limosilactobacillus fermentum]